MKATITKWDGSKIIVPFPIQLEGNYGEVWIKGSGIEVGNCSIDIAPDEELREAEDLIEDNILDGEVKEGNIDINSEDKLEFYDQLEEDEKYFQNKW